MSVITAILLSISANLDTFTVAVSYGIQKVKLNFLTLTLITLITTAGTFISMEFGLSISRIISSDITALIGSLMLVGIGFYMLFSYIRKTIKSNHDTEKALDNLESYSNSNNDKPKELDIKESIILSLALTINNLGIGVAASIAGISIYLNTLFTFIITIISLVLGLFIGNSYLSRYFGKYGELISAIIIIVLGIYECLA